MNTNINEIKINISGKNRRFGIVVSRFNELITEKLLTGAVDTLTRSEVSEKDIDVVRVPGAFEIPLIAKKMALTKKYDGIICLGAVIRGDTSHYDHVCNEVSKGVSHVNLETQIPVIFGIITTNNLEQALDRAGGKAGNKGRDAALTALEMASIIKSFM